MLSESLILSSSYYQKRLASLPTITKAVTVVVTISTTTMSTMTMATTRTITITTVTTTTMTIEMRDTHRWQWQWNHSSPDNVRKYHEHCNGKTVQKWIIHIRDSPARAIYQARQCRHPQSGRSFRFHTISAWSPLLIRLPRPSFGLHHHSLLHVLPVGLELVTLLLYAAHAYVSFVYQKRVLMIRPYRVSCFGAYQHPERI